MRNRRAEKTISSLEISHAAFSLPCIHEKLADCLSCCFSLLSMLAVTKFMNSIIAVDPLLLAQSPVRTPATHIFYPWAWRIAVIIGRIILILMHVAALYIPTDLPHFDFQHFPINWKYFWNFGQPKKILLYSKSPYLHMPEIIIREM